MTTQLVHDAANLLKWLPVGLAVFGGLWAFAAARREPMARRPDARLATWLAVGVGIAAALVEFAFPNGTNPFGDAIGYAGLVGAGGFLVATLGYALLARLGVGRAALIGAVALPLVLYAAVAILVQVERNAENELESTPAGMTTLA